jgi:hypothetical protein
MQAKQPAHEPLQSRHGNAEAQKQVTANCDAAHRPLCNGNCSLEIK